MNESVVNFLLTLCYLILIALIAGISAYILMKQHAKKLVTVHIRVDDIMQTRSTGSKTVRVALVSDFHIPHMPPPKEAVVSTITKASPDFVIIAGDLCEERKFWSYAADFIGEIADNAACRVFVVLGNHDIKDACENKPELIEEYRKVIENSHPLVTVLVDEKYYFACEGTERRFLIGGLNDYSRNTPERILTLCKNWSSEAKGHEAEFILASHNPDCAIHIPRAYGPSMLFSGHTHAGQMWMPFNAEFRFMRKDVLPKEGYKYGLHIYKEKFPIYITSGVGCTFLPIRFKSIAEVAIIDM